MMNLSGLDYLSKVKNNELPHAPIHKIMNMKIIEISFGIIIYEFIPLECHLNLQGGVNGGYYACILDGITGGAAHSTINKNQSIATIDLNTKMLRPLKINQVYLGIGKLVHQGREIVVTEGIIQDKEANIYASGSAILKKKII